MAEQQESFFSKLRDDPAVKGLMSNIGSYATAKGEDIARRKMPGAEDADGVIDAGKKEAKKRAIVPAVKGFISGAWQKLTKGSKAGKRPHNILETAIVGAPVEMVWDTWLDFEQWPNFMKGPEKVEIDKDEDKDDESEGPTTNWTAKVFVHRRQWKSTITEQVEYERLRWKSEAPKGQVDGVVSFAPAGENLTFVVLVIEYRPKGFFEGVGKLWRVAGRRARLDFKHFQRHVAMVDQSEQLSHDERDEQEEPVDQGTEEPEGTNGAVGAREQRRDDEGAESEEEVGAEPVPST